MYRPWASLYAFVGSLLLFSPAVFAFAQQAEQKVAELPPITIEHKPGHEDGEAQMVINGKVRKISPHAVAAFTVRGGEGALIIVLQPAKGALPKQYLLRYYDLETSRRRVMTLALSAAALKTLGAATDSKPAKP